ncbi:uncharacterized protein B0I36DRAFT_10701 [Microdochium trichocladiopsis]|uniref:BHLH domain-containing protein n=1 Tax=Microdochium trichocladiopsis TaxID=1682393 RepID=A0A9P8YH78_9PEZI|nr:uncharacterized protein B0I36DRAFT_10701 [Microdochium trichocladiopsis]KAH7040461.1 hypothetical protein B0I36DRAFT_10701 [Microdochium trichocladiopsis]
MLATERPRMGSSRPANGDMPFNYDYPDHNEFGMPVAAPEPPRGEPLLTQNDSQLLMNFFQDINSNQFNFSFGEGLSFSDDWLNLPPTFMGSSTSFGQQPSQPYSSVPPDFLGLDTTNLNNMYHFGESMPSPHTPMTPISQHQPQQHQHHRPIPQPQHHLPSPHYPPPAPPQQHRPQQRYQEPQRQQMHMQQSHPQAQHALHTPADHTAQEDIAAVLTAMGNGNQNGHNQNGHRIIQQHNGRPAPYRSPTEPTRPTNAQHFGVQRQASHPRLHAEEETDNLFTNMVFGNQHMRQNRPPEARTELQWGSDSAFDRNQGYIPSSHNETAEALEKERLEYIKCFSLNKSAANTQPSSPNPAGVEGSFGANGHLGIANDAGETDGTMPPTKRRKSKAKVDISGAVSSEPPTFEAKPPPKKRKPKTETNGLAAGTSGGLVNAGVAAVAAAAAAAAAATTSTPSETPKRKRPSAAKPPRENLTDSQKRENHIKSEQRRRGAIKEGFDGLTEIIPNLKAGGYSKSMMLGMAGDWLQKLIEGNRALAEQQNI